MTVPGSLSMRHAVDAPRPGVGAVPMVLGFLCVSALLSYWILTRTVVDGQPQLDRAGLMDFRDAVYYPVVAFLDGNNPYDAPTYAKKYPVGLAFPLYSPLTLVFHAPFGMLRFDAAALAFHLLNLVLTPVLAWLALRAGGLAATVAQTFLIATLILVSRGGSANLNLGQCTTYVTIAAYTALSFARTRPWLAGIGLAVSTLKPTFGVPLAVLMLGRRDWRAVLIGAALAAAITVPTAAVLGRNAGGVRPFLASLQESQRSFEADPGAKPLSSPRVDTPSLAGRLLGTVLPPGVELAVSLAVLGLGAIGVSRIAAREDDPRRVRSAGLICITVLACVYHQNYDLPLLTLPVVGLAAGTSAPGAPPVLRGLLLALLALPMANYLTSSAAIASLGLAPPGGVRSGWVLAITAANSGALFLAFALSVGSAFRGAGRNV